MPPVGAGGASVHVGTDAPDSYKEGDLWFNTTETELTLYVYDGSVWVLRTTRQPGRHRQPC